MVANLQAARVGSGGVSIPVILQDPDTRQAFAKLRADVAQASKDLKVKPQIDYEETQFVRSLQTSLRKIERENAKIRVAVELDEKGLATAAVRAGAITQQQLSAARAGQPAAPLRAGFSGVEAEIRGVMASEIRSMRNAARAETVRAEANRRLYGEPVEVERFRSYDGAGQLMSARAGSGSEGIAARIANAGGVPGVADTPAGARASLAAANRLYQERMDLEKKFLDQMKAEEGGEDGDGEAKRLRKVWRAGRAPSRAADYGGIFGALKAVGIFDGAMRIAGTSAYDANQRFTIGAAGANSQAGMQASVNLAESWKSTPVIGSIVKLFDEASGFTRALKVRMEANLDIRSAAVDAARLTRSRTLGAEAEGKEELQGMVDKYGQNGIVIDDAGERVSAQGFGSATNQATRSALSAYVAKKVNVAARVARARAELNAEQDVMRARIAATGLDTARDPREAARVAMRAENKAAADLAEPELQELTQRLGDARYKKMVADQNRSLWADTFGSQTRIAASQMRVNNHGLSLDDENAFTTLRGYDAAITAAPEAGGYKARARMDALAGARALQASLVVRGGGNADIVDLATHSAASDPFNIRPETMARVRAQRMTSAYVKKMGGDDALNLNASLSPGESVSTPTQKIIQLLSAMVELLGRSAVIPQQS
jgi:hypothetical protein